MRATKLAKLLCWILVGAMLGGGFPSHPASADLVTTESVIARVPTSEGDRARLRAALERDDVRAQLQAYGVSAEEAAARANALTDREVALIADRLDEVPAGAGGDAIIGLLLVGPIFLAAAAIVGTGWLIVQIVKAVAKHRKARQSPRASVAGAPTEPIEGIVFLEVVSEDSEDDSVTRVGYASAERCEDERKRSAHLVGTLWKRMECVEATR